MPTGVGALTCRFCTANTPSHARHHQAQLNTALDQVLEEPADGLERCGCVLVTGEGKFWSNGLDLKYLDTLTHNQV